MNCCNEFGQCTQGLDCPVRASKLDQENSDGSDRSLPVVMLEQPWQWLTDLLYTAIFFVGSVTLGALLLAVLVWVTGLHRVIF